MAVIPRPASTVVIMDQMARVYMTKRPKTMKFLAGYFVFPGGAVEPQDYIEETEQMKAPNAGVQCHPANYVAAARELFEEIGIFLGTMPPLQKNSEEEYRIQLMNGEISFLEMVKQESLTLDLSRLHYLGYKVTPESSPVRFATCFFLATLPKGQQPKPDQNEIEEAFWISPQDALLAHQNGQLPMVQPTLLSLQKINQALMDGTLIIDEHITFQRKS